MTLTDRIWAALLSIDLAAIAAWFLVEAVTVIALVVALALRRRS